MKKWFAAYALSAVMVAVLCLQVAGADDFSTDFEMDKFFVSPYEAVQFTNRSTGNIDDWSWHFGDGHVSYEWHPHHQYIYTGTYSVTLTLTNTLSAIGMPAGETKSRTNIVTVAHYQDVSMAERVVDGSSVFIKATPPEWHHYYTVEEGLPEGVSPANISNKGHWRPEYRRIQWGPFHDIHPRTLTYTTLGVEGEYTLSGVIHTEVDSRLTGGDTELILQSGTGTVKVKLETTMGDVILELYPEQAPVTVANFLKYVDDGFYEGTIFHRVIAGFIIQGGGYDSDMNQNATRDPIVNEAGNGLSNMIYTVAMARTLHPDSATSQFFINLDDNLFLDQSHYGDGYAVFATVIQGKDVVNAISVVNTMDKDVYQDVPVEPIFINAASRVSDDNDDAPGDSDDEDENLRRILSGKDQEIDIVSDSRIIGTGASETLNISPNINVDFTAGDGDRVNLPYQLEHYEITSKGNYIWFSDVDANKVATIIVTGTSTIGFADGSAATLEIVFTLGGPPQVHLGGAVVSSTPLDHGEVEF